MRWIALWIGAIMVTNAAVAALQTMVVEYKHGDTVLEGYFAWDDAVATESKPAPAVLVIPEWWGNNEYARGRARELATLGYVAFAIDMYGKGKITTDPKQASEWSGAIMKDVPARRARAAAGLDVLKSRKNVDAGRIGVIGYCMGGTLAIDLARTGADLKAVVAFHASTFSAAKPEENKLIKGTVLICHGSDDAFVPAGEIEKFQSQMKDAGVDYVFVAFSGAVHAFTNPDADSFKVPGVRHHAEADRRSWAFMRDIFREKLAPPKPGT